MVYGKDRYFDNEVMTQLNDNHTPRNYDGSAGGWHPLNSNPFARTSLGRAARGYIAGKADAEIIIANLERDKNGNIIETIKIVTHSMGGAYGKGFVIALKEYIKSLPVEQQKQINISLVADFDPFQADNLTADPDIKTIQFKHKGNKNIFGMGWLANQDENGLDPKKDIKPNTGTSSDHSITSFFGDIEYLEVGTYKWDDEKQKFVKQ
jgi:hypothetical protein